MPVPLDFSPHSSSSKEEFSNFLSHTVQTAAFNVLKVSQWRQAILSCRPGDRRRAHAVAAAAQSLARAEADGLPPTDCPKATHFGGLLEHLGCGKDVPDSDAEEEDWELHRQKTGLVAKLVTYDSSDRLLSDFRLRPGVRRSGAVVLTVLPGGQCDRAGVQAGDRLVSVNGRQDFSLYEDRSMKVPMKLVFMGTAGKITSEVRLVTAESKTGFNLISDQVLKGARTSYLYQEERIFVPNLASLALGVQAEPCRTPQMFSLEPKEAAKLLRRAKNDAEARLRGLDSPGEASVEEASENEVWLEVSRPACFSDDAILTGNADWGWRKARKDPIREDSFGFSESEPMEAEKL